MQQTLLAMLALIIASFLHFNRMQSNVRAEHQIVRSEMEEMATGIAMQTMEVIRAREFDEATDGVASDVQVPLSDLTPGPFTTGNHCQAFGGADVCNDVDDFHEMKPAIIPFETPNMKMDFRVEVQVRYLGSDMTPTGGAPSIRKEVVVRVQDDQANQPPFLDAPIRFSETLTYN
jgi:hypothetical protein